MRILHGIPGSDGIAIGTVIVFRETPITLPDKRLTAEEIETEIQAYQDAVAHVESELSKAAQQVKQEIGTSEAAIFNAHIGILCDPDFFMQVTTKIRTEWMPAANAIWHVMEESTAMFDQLDDIYLRTRANDIRDVCERLMRTLTGEKLPDLSHLPQACILAGHNITPSHTASMDKNNVIALVSETGNSTSHAVILARSLGIPAIVGVTGAIGALSDGEQVIVDGTNGVLMVHPDKHALNDAQIRAAHWRKQQSTFALYADAPAKTKDGHAIDVQANIGIPEQVSAAVHLGAEGIGLLRSEFFYMGRNTFPSEEEQYRGYRSAAKVLKGKPLIIRTMDIGGDKHLNYFPLIDELNPFLGYRALRICLTQPEIFKPQLRALLRASVVGNVSALLPMVSSIDEIEQALEMLETCKEELRTEGKPFRADMPVGIMIEVPAIAMQIKDAAKLVDFFSIGTNDLLQYSLAVDRTNEKISKLYQPFHPGILRTIDQVIKTANEENTPISMCGELAGTPVAIPLLLGMGLRHFSMSASSIPQAKALIRNITMESCTALTTQALTCSKSSAVHELCSEFLKQHEIKF